MSTDRYSLRLGSLPADAQHDVRGRWTKLLPGSCLAHAKQAAAQQLARSGHPFLAAPRVVRVYQPPAKPPVWSLLRWLGQTRRVFHHPQQARQNCVWAVPVPSVPSCQAPRWCHAYASPNGCPLGFRTTPKNVSPLRSVLGQQSSMRPATTRLPPPPPPPLFVRTRLHLAASRKLCPIHGQPHLIRMCCLRQCVGRRGSSEWPAGSWVWTRAYRACRTRGGIELVGRDHKGGPMGCGRWRCCGNANI